MNVEKQLRKLYLQTEKVKKKCSKQFTKYPFKGPVQVFVLFCLAAKPSYGKLICSFASLPLNMLSHEKN
jgi:hypothetical protein